jgi:hypothetical protein
MTDEGLDGRWLPGGKIYSTRAYMNDTIEFQFGNDPGHTEKIKVPGFCQE